MADLYRIGVFVAALLTASACGDGPVRPPELPGEYTLRHAAGQPLPATVFDATIHDPDGGTPDFRLTVVVSSGSLALTEDGWYEHAVDLRPAIDGVPQVVVHWNDRGRYTREGDSLHFASEFIENLRFAGSFEGGRVELEQDLVGEGTRARYSFENP